MNQGSRRGSKGPAVLHICFGSLIYYLYQPRHDNSTTVFQVRPYGRFIETQSNFRRKKLHRTNQGSNSLGGSFSKNDNVRTPIQFRRERQPQDRKRWFFFKNKRICFYISNTSVIKPVKLNKLSFFSIKINKLFPTQVHSVL